MATFNWCLYMQVMRPWRHPLPAAGRVPRGRTGPRRFTLRRGREAGVHMALQAAENDPRRNGHLPTNGHGYQDNRVQFEEYYALQRTLVDQLARHPTIVRAWLDSMPSRDDEATETSGASKSWRAARVNAARRRTLSELITSVEQNAEHSHLLANFLLISLPVESYFVIAEGGATPGTTGNAWSASCRAITAKRNELFDANLGLAKAAVRGRRNYDELLSAALVGLLAAIDRYVPNNQKSARFGYFATFWIRYHISRYTQKTSGVVSLSINQQRIIRRIDRFVEQCRTEGRPEPTQFEICSALNISADAYGSFLRRPVVVSLDQSASPGGDDSEREVSLANVIASEEPEPDQEVEDAEIAHYVRRLLRSEVSAFARVMLSYARRIGSLFDASEDYLLALEEQALVRLRFRVKSCGNSSHCGHSALDVQPHPALVPREPSGQCSPPLIV